MWIWLFDGVILYLLITTVPLLGLGCLLYYLLCVGVAVKEKPAIHKGMQARLKELKIKQDENNRIYQQKEIDKVKEHWHNTKHQRLTPLQLVALAALCIVIGWSLKHV